MLILGHNGTYKASKFDCFKVNKFSFGDGFYVAGYEYIKRNGNNPEYIILASYATEADAKAALHDLIYAIAENAQLHEMKPREG